MARPIRAAAQRAKELIAAGLATQVLQADDVEGMSSGEEDELDDELCIEEEMQPDHGDDVSTGEDEGPQADQHRYLSFDDIDQEPAKIPFEPERPPGPQLPGDAVIGNGQYCKAIDYFMLFFTRDMIEVICRNTNLYAWMMILTKQSYAAPDGSWDAVTIDELQRYLGLVIMLGFIQLPNIDKYWSQATLYSGNWAPRFMSRTRYRAISAMLHITDPAEENPDDKLGKIRPLMEHIKGKCSELYQPHAELSVDERMVKSKARTSLRQYMPNKPARFGYKMWCLCQSKSGYTINFDVYTGRKQQPRAHGLGFDVVTSLVSKYCKQGYKCFFDNFFTSIPLIKYLTAHGFGACGTTLSTRRGFPSELKDKEWIKKSKRGDTRYIREEGILCQQWMDTKAVSICSTMHKGNDFVMVKRYVKKSDGSHEQALVKKPTAIHAYNMFMGGVDLSDQRLESYSILHKCRRWWKTLFFHLLDMSILNSYILFKEMQELHPDVDELKRPPGYSHLAFREELVRQLAHIRDDEDPPMSAARPRSRTYFAMDTVHVPMYSKKRRNCYVCYVMTKKPVQTQWSCSHEDCELPICLNSERNCFSLLHSDEFQRLRCRMGR